MLDLEFKAIPGALPWLPAKLWVHLNPRNGSLGVATANTKLVTWRGVGKGSLTTRTFYPMGHAAFGAGMRIARLDGDARNDVVVSHHSSMGRVSVFAARAHGGLNPEQLYGSEAYAGAVAVDDFNRDGRARKLRHLSLSPACQAPADLSCPIHNRFPSGSSIRNSVMP